MLTIRNGRSNLRSLTSHGAIFHELNGLNKFIIDHNPIKNYTASLNPLCFNRDKAFLIITPLIPIDKLLSGSYQLILAHWVLFSTTEIMDFNYFDRGLILITGFSGFITDCSNKTWTDSEQEVSHQKCLRSIKLSGI